jgi:hypothetical protein
MKYASVVRLKVPSLLGLSLAAVACDPPSSAEPVATTTHALLRVERSARVGAERDAIGQAFAGVVRVPELADPELMLRLSGKGAALPALGQCALPSRERDSVPASDLARAEFLDAGLVALGANAVQTLLAPHNFPSEVSGVVYTSRDRDSEPLPSGAGYSLKMSGSDQLPAMELRVQAPEELTDVMVGADSLSALSSVAAAAEVPFTWRPGDPRDTVYVEVAGSGETGSLGICAFRDSDGRGALPRGLFGASGTGSLTFHRLREVAADVPALDGAEVRFDFALTAEVAFR